MGSRAVSVDPSSLAFRRVLQILLLLIVTLMALGAGVRTMNAGLSCPDWPLCFGKVIPDFHPGTYFEFIHRAYAGLVSIVFMGVAIYALRSPTLPRAVKVAAGCGIGALILQIVMGGLTVLLLVKAVIVTGHLICATLFFCSVLAMYFFANPSVERNRRAAPLVLPRITGFFCNSDVLANHYRWIRGVDLRRFGLRGLATLQRPMGADLGGCHRSADLASLCCLLLSGRIDCLRTFDSDLESA